jgi:DNA-binding MarR family transcriptional regulator
MKSSADIRCAVYDGGMERSREDLLHDAATVYARASRVLDPVRLQVWEAMGVSLPQLRILYRIRARPGLDVRGLAEGLGISPSAASQQVDKLVARGLVRRTENPEDRRHVRLEVTDLGQQAIGEISRTTRSHLQGVLSVLSDTELDELHRLLSRVVTAAGAQPVPVNQ